MAKTPIDDARAFLEGKISPAEAAARAIAVRRRHCPECDRLVADHEARRRERLWVDPARWPEPVLREPPAPREVRIEIDRLRERPAAALAAALARASAVFDRPEAVPALLAEGRARIHASPASALVWNSFAAGVAAALPETPAYARLLLVAHAERANALRALGRLPEAATLWPRIESALADLPLAGPAEEGAIWSLEASLFVALREFPAAARLLDRAERLFELGGDALGVAKIFAQRGTAADLAGDAASAVRWHLRAADRLDPEAEPLLFWITQNNLADSLVALGEPAEAARVLAAGDPIYRRVRNAGLMLRRTWVEAHIAGALGRPDVARAGLGAVLAECKTQRRAYDYVLVQLDLARLGFAQGSSEGVRAAAEALAPAIKAGRLPAAMAAALGDFRRAVAEGRADAALAAELRRYLPLAKRDPSFAFERGFVLTPPPPPPDLA